jgi:hypothetical protein
MKTLLAVTASLASSLGWAQSPAPEREATANTLRSERDPAIRIELPDAAVHVGAHRWVLYDIADCEVHVFVEADASKRVRRLYWIQFEGYIPSQPEARYDYSRDAVVEFAGRPFHVSTTAAEDNQKPRPRSDTEQVLRLLQSRGFSVPPTSLSVRLVYLFDDDRKELMFIYSEDMASRGLTPAEVRPGGAAESKWPEIEKQMIDEARKRIHIAWK